MKEREVLQSHMGWRMAVGPWRAATRFEWLPESPFGSLQYPWFLRETRNRILAMRTIRHYTGLAVQVACLVSVMLLLQGCPAKPPPSGVRFPITSGSHTSLPSTHQLILIWGDPSLTDVASEWLSSHHYASILLPHSGPGQHQVSHTSSDRQAALAVAKEMNADFVLLLDREDNKEGALIESHCGPLFSVSVNVRGLSVQRGETVLQGNAHYPHCVELRDEIVRSLTCQALATAWGFRPSGQLDIPGGLMCTTGQTAPMPIR